MTCGEKKKNRTTHKKNKMVTNFLSSSTLSSSFGRRVLPSSRRVHITKTRRRRKVSLNNNETLLEGGCCEKEKAVLGVGSCGLDILARLEKFPQPDEKTRSETLVMEVGGNCANALTAVSRLSEASSSSILFTKIGDDATGKDIISILEREGDTFDTSKIVQGGTSPSTYIICVKDKANDDPTRTCIHTPSNEPLMNSEVTDADIDALFASSPREIGLAYFDGRLTDVALRIAIKARSLGIKILVEAERLRGDDLDALLKLADFCVCSKSYPQEKHPNDTNSFGTALTEMANSTLSDRCKLLIATLGSRGSVALLFDDASVDTDTGATVLVRSVDEIIEEMERAFQSRKQSEESGTPYSSSSSLSSSLSSSYRYIPEHALISDRVYNLNGSGKRAKVVFQPAARISSEDMVDTTGAGDAFIGTVAKGLSCGADILKTLRLATFVAAQKCLQVGARAGLPFREEVPEELMYPFAASSGELPTATSRKGRRSAMTTGAISAFLLAFSFSAPNETFAAINGSSVDMNKLSQLFNQAMNASSYEDAESAWSKAIELAPNNSAALSNRGTLRLQAGQWSAAIEDLQRSIEIDVKEGKTADASVLNNLGNAKGAVGDWESAMDDFLKASKDDSMREIALANYALAAFETGMDELAVKTAQTILRKDPEFWDMRAALTAFHWGAGDLDKAEYEWQTLCTSGRGFGQSESAEGVRSFGDVAYASKLLEQQLKQQLDIAAGVTEDELGNDTPCQLYKTTDTVAGRWPPRPTAALDAYLRVKDVGQALDYDGIVKEYKFK